MIFIQRQLTLLLVLLCYLILIGTQPVYAQAPPAPITGINSIAGQPLDLGASGSVYMTISTAGLVGIGTSTPTALLDLGGSYNNTLGNNVKLAIYDDGSVTFGFGVSKGGATPPSLDAITNDMFAWYVQGVSTPLMTLQKQGLVVQNQGTPVAATSYYSAAHFGPWNGVWLGYDTVGSGGVIGALPDGVPNNLLFTTWTSNGSSGSYTEKMRITATGSIGIGTTAPNGTLDIENGSNNATFCLNGNCSGFTPQSCHLVRNQGPPPTYVSDARCNPGEFAINGGGYVVIPADTNSTDLANCPTGPQPGFLHTSIPDGDGMGWSVDGYNASFTADVCTVAYATCCTK